MWIRPKYRDILWNDLLKDLKAVQKSSGAVAADAIMSMMECNLLVLRPFSPYDPYIPVTTTFDTQTAVAFLLPSYVWAAKEILKDTTFVEQFATPKKEA